MMRTLAIIVFAVGLVFALQHSPVSPTPGATAPAEPIQAPTTAKPWGYKDVAVFPLATYQITARLLHRCNYFFDGAAKYAPMDFVLGWGELSDPAIYRKISFSQSGRWYFFTWGRDFPASIASTIARFSANTHIIPATDDVRRQLDSFRVNQTITLTGYLVQLKGPRGFTWGSSTTREDTGDHSCELLWVNSAEEK